MWSTAAVTGEEPKEKKAKVVRDAETEGRGPGAASGAIESELGHRPEKESQGADERGSCPPPRDSAPAPSSQPVSFAVDADALAPLFFTGLFVSTILALLYVLSSFVADAVVSFIILGLCQQPYRFVRAKVGHNRWVASALVTCAIVVLILLPTGGFLYALVKETQTAFASGAHFFDHGGQDFVAELIAWADGHGVTVTSGAITEYLQHLATGMNSMVVVLGGALFGNVLSLTVHAATVIVMIFYLFADGPRLRDFLFKLSPLPDDEDAQLVETFQKVSRGVVVGNGFGSAIQGVLGGLAMWMVDLPSPLLWGAVMTVFAFLPLIGVTIVVVPAAAFLAVQGRVSEAFGFFVFCVVMALFVDNVVKTKMMGSAMRLHDLLVFLSIVGGLAAFGVIGFVYGPLIAMLFMTLHGLYEQRYLPRIAHSFGSSSLRPPSRSAHSTTGRGDEYGP